MDATRTDPTLVTVKQAARQRGLNPPILYRAIRRGELPAFQIGAWLRVRLPDVDDWLDTQRVNHPREDAGRPSRGADGGGSADR